MSRWMYRTGIVAAVVAALAACSEPPVTLGSPVSQPTGPVATTAATPSAQPTPGIYRMGTKVAVPATFDGITSVTVFGYYPNVHSVDPTADNPQAGRSFAAIDVQVCAGPKGSGTGPNTSAFAVLLSNGSTAGDNAEMVGPPAVPGLSDESGLGSSFSALAPGQCLRGWLAYSVPDAVKPTFVQYSGVTGAIDTGDSVVKWAIS